MGNRAVITSFTTDTESSEIIKNLVKRYAPNNPELFEIELKILVAVAQKEQMIEDHKLYLSKE